MAMTALQALTTGVIAGSLSRQTVLTVSVQTQKDDDGNYLPEIVVQGLKSGERLLVSVTPVEGDE